MRSSRLTHDLFKVNANLFDIKKISLKLTEELRQIVSFYLINKERIYYRPKRWDNFVNKYHYLRNY